MTVLGKILVFVNLIFSLLTGGLIVMVYTTRTNWNAAYTKEKAALAIVRAGADAEHEAYKKLLADKEGELQASIREKKAGDALLAKEKQDLAAARQELDAAKTANTSVSTLSQAQADEMNRRKQEVEKLEALVKEREQKVAEIDRQMAKHRDEAVQYRIQFESAKARNDELLKTLQAKEQELTALRGQFGPGKQTPTGPAPTPVPEDFKGTIRTIQGDLATITPGSDAGAAIGAELQVYRLSPPEYLGKIVIQAVTPHEAVGRLVGAARSKVKTGDKVAARLGS